MSGITILDVREAFLPAVYEYQNIIIPILIILAVMSFVGALFFMEHGIVPYIFTCIFVLSVLFTFIFACAQPTRYDVIVDDSVNYNEFIEKYNVIKVKGKVYTIELKDR